MWSASSPWPHASWKRMPPLPPASTTGSSPEGAGRASSLAIARAAAIPASSSTGDPIEQLESLGPGHALEPGLHPGVAGGHAAHVEPGPDLVVLGEQPLGVGDQHPPATVAVADLDLGDRAAGRAGRVVGSRQELELGRLVHLERSTTACAGAPVGAGGRATVSVPAAALPGHRGRRLGRRQQARTPSGRRCGRSRSSRR